jgi:hypothetical protein
VVLDGRGQIVGSDPGAARACPAVGRESERIRPECHEARDVGRRRLLELDRDEHARATATPGSQADTLLGELRQELVGAQALAVHLQRQPDQSELGAAGTLAKLVAAGDLPVGPDDLLDDDRQVGRERGAQGPVQTAQPRPQFSLQSPPPGGVGDQDLDRDGMAPLAKRSPAAASCALEAGAGKVEPSDMSPEWLATVL